MSLWSRIAAKFTGRPAGRITPAPVVTDPHSRGIEREFRLSNDPEYMIRINQQPPPGLPRKLAEFVAVAGITQPDTLPMARAFISGSSRKLELVRILDHPVDPNAIAVIGHWIEGDTEHTARLGYLPADVAAKVAKVASDIPIGATLKVMYAPAAGRSPGLRLDIWVPRQRAVRAAERPYQSRLRVPSDPVERNSRGIELEAEGLVDNAVECYEANVRDGFDGDHPYNRLAIIYRRRGDTQREVAVLNRAIEVFEQLQGSPRADVASKLEQFRQQLGQALVRDNNRK